MKQVLLSGIMILWLSACQEKPEKPIPELPNPPSFEKTYVDTHNGYSEAVVLTSGNLKTIYVSGQIGEGADLETQMRDALSKIERLLKGSGADMTDIVKMNTYIVDYGAHSLDIFRKVRKELMGDSEMPASTLVGVEALALPEWLIEIEAVAVAEIQ